MQKEARVTAAKTKVIYVKRFSDDPEESGWVEPFAVPVEERTTVLQALQYIYENLDPALAFEYSCRYAKCGLCGVEVTGRPRLACTSFLKDEETVVAPLPKLPIIRDLVIDRSPLEKLLRIEKIYFSGASLEEVAGHEKVKTGHYFTPIQVSPDLGRLLSCLECLCCHAACPKLDAFSKDLARFAGPYVFLKLAQLMLDPRDRIDRKAQAYRLGIEQCSDCRRCYCPRGIPIYSLAIEPFLD